MQKTLIKYLVFIILGVASYKYGEHVGLSRIPEVKTVVKVQERVRTRTKIIERPDGTKVTVIDEKKETKSDTKIESRPSVRQWSASLSWAPPQRSKPEVFTLGINRRFIGDLSVGVYGRTDSEFGISLRYEF